MNNERYPKASTRWRAVNWLVVFTYAFLIFYLSSLPDPSPVSLPSMTDKLVHFVEYSILGFLLFRALDGTAGSEKALFLSFLAAALYGITDEIHQYYVPTREADIFDVLADAAGGLAGGYAGFMIKRGGSVG